MLHSLAHQGITRDAYLRIAGREEAEIVEQSKPDAEQALRREAVLAAIIDAEGIEPTEEEVLEAVEQAAGEGAQRTSPKKLLERLKSAGRLDEPQGGPRPAQGARPRRRVGASRSRSTRRRPATSCGRRATPSAPRAARRASSGPRLPSRKTGRDGVPRLLGCRRAPSPEAEQDSSARSETKRGP